MLKIKYRVLLLSVATIVGVLLFAGFLLVEKRQVSTEMANLNWLARLGPAISALVHELQRELTDEKWAALGTAFDAFDGDAYGTRLAAKVNAARPERYGRWPRQVAVLPHDPISNYSQ